MQSQVHVSGDSYPGYPGDNNSQPNSHQKRVFVCFVDFGNAFEKVPHVRLINSLVNLTCAISGISVLASNRKN